MEEGHFAPSTSEEMKSHIGITIFITKTFELPILPFRPSQ
jgi:hypothetical protein